MSIALPSAQADLGISDVNPQWVITAYALAFGGQIADLWGRKRTFIVGLNHGRPVAAGRDGADAAA